MKNDRPDNILLDKQTERGKDLSLLPFLFKLFHSNICFVHILITLYLDGTQFQELPYYVDYSIHENLTGILPINFLENIWSTFSSFY